MHPFDPRKLFYQIDTWLELGFVLGAEMSKHCSKLLVFLKKLKHVDSMYIRKEILVLKGKQGVVGCYLNPFLISGIFIVVVVWGRWCLGSCKTPLTGILRSRSGALIA